MALSVQNKNFLAVLNKLDIDIKQFSDKTFDGLFENVPEVTSYFFNWFIENISPDNALTQSEQATYFHLESSQSLPNEEEINYVLSSSNPGYEQLMSLDSNYINNFLPQDLEDLKKNHEELSDIFTALESDYSDIKKKQNNLKEEINIKEKQLIIVKQQSHEMNLLFGSKIDEVKMLLLREPNFTLGIDLFNELLAEEENIFNEFNSIKSVKNEIFNFSRIDLFYKLEEDLACVENSLVLSEGYFEGDAPKTGVQILPLIFNHTQVYFFFSFLKEKEAKFEFLMELLQKENAQKTINVYNMIYDEEEEETEMKISEEIRVLESQLFDKRKEASHVDVQKIYDHYLLNKIDLSDSYLSKLSSCRDYIKSSWKINSCLLQILLSCTTHLDNFLNLRKQLFSKLIKYETNFTNDITNLELRQQRFKDVSIHDNQHPVLEAFKNIMSNENPGNYKEALKNAFRMKQNANDDSDFIMNKLKRDLQWSIKGFFGNTLCGPTSQLLFVPIELLIKFQECEKREARLSHVIKRLTSKYVEAKETISKSDRRKLLLWINFLINPQALINHNSPQS